MHGISEKASLGLNLTQLTSLNGSKVEDRIHPAHRHWYLPIYPVPPESLYRHQLQLADKVILRKPGYLSLRETYTVPRSMLRLYDTQKPASHYRLSVESFNAVAEILGVGTIDYTPNIPSKTSTTPPLFSRMSDRETGWTHSSHNHTSTNATSSSPTGMDIPNGRPWVFSTPQANQPSPSANSTHKESQTQSGVDHGYTEPRKRSLAKQLIKYGALFLPVILFPGPILALLYYGTILFGLLLSFLVLAAFIIGPLWLILLAILWILLRLRR